MDASPLNTLPTELRLEIYQLVLDWDGFPAHIRSYIGKVFTTNATHHMLANTATCKLMRQESLPVLFGKSDFIYSRSVLVLRAPWNESRQLDVVDVRPLKGWPKCIEKDNAASIRRLTIKLGILSTTSRARSDTKWWVAANSAAQQLIAKGLSKQCEVSVEVRVSFSETPALLCFEGDESIKIEKSFDVVVPTGEPGRARDVVKKAVSAWEKDYEAHALQFCEARTFLASITRSLERTRSALMSAIAE